VPRRTPHRAPTHKHHGVYDKPCFGFKDEGHTVKDYRELRKHLKDPRSKQILNHIIPQEVHHKGEFNTIQQLERDWRKEHKK
jgi:rubrerythrin